MITADLTAEKELETSMLRRSAATSAPTTSLPNSSIMAAAEVVESWHTPTSTGWFDTVKDALALPTTARGFGIFFLVLMLLSAATFMQVLLSSQILAAEFRVAGMQAAMDGIEQQNAEVASEIAMVSQMDNLAGRALSAGFVPVSKPTYVERTAEALDASPVARPQPFYMELPSTDSAAGISPGEWLGSIEGTFSHALAQVREWAVSGVAGVRNIGQ
jgi:hypothetical protein